MKSHDIGIAIQVTHETFRTKKGDIWDFQSMICPVVNSRSNASGYVVSYQTLPVN